MRAPSTLCLVLALTSLGCSGSQKWVSEVGSPASHSTKSAVNLTAEHQPDAAEYRPWGAVRPRLSEVMTLGESDLPAVAHSQETSASTPAQPVVVNVNNYAAAPAPVWPMYGVWGVNRGNNAFGSNHTNMRVGQSRSPSVPPVGSNWPSAANQAPRAPSSPPQSVAPVSDKSAQTQAQRVGATTCASCITTGR